MAQKFKRGMVTLIAFAMLFTAAFASNRYLIPGGHTTGIKLFCDGVMVVRTVSGLNSPGKTAGIREGDVILEINGNPVCTNEALKSQVEKSKNQPVEIVYRRGGKIFKTKVTPAKDASGTPQLGLWVRDSMAGIGTVTFYDAENATFGALGHGVCDTETNLLVPIRSGGVMESGVKEVQKGVAGSPGELIGEYQLNEDSGVIRSNTEQGIFGTFTKKPNWLEKSALPVASKNEVQLGSATILSNINGNDVREYQIEITQIYETNAENGKSMMLRVTDQNLIAQTGGIVQGMSGSPIIQNGKLVGAVTHVLVSDPTRGYGIFIENMLKAGESVSDKQLNQAS